MKYTYIIIAILLVACKKDKEIEMYASINVINASVNAGTVKVNYHGKQINLASYSGAIGNLNFGTSQILTIFNLNNDYPFSIVRASDSTNVIFSQKIKLEPKGIFSLFTTGQAPTYESVFIKEENIPYGLPDSAISIRFINLSPNSPLIKITLASFPTINEVAELAYKQYSSFKSYPSLKAIPNGSLSFQVRDVVTNVILTTYILPTTPVSPYLNISTSLSRFKSITLAIKGLAGTTNGVNTYSIFPIPHY